MTIAVIKRAASVVIKLGENTAEAARQASIARAAVQSFSGTLDGVPWVSFEGLSLSGAAAGLVWSSNMLEVARAIKSVHYEGPGVGDSDRFYIEQFYNNDGSNGDKIVIARVSDGANRLDTGTGTITKRTDGVTVVEGTYAGGGAAGASIFFRLEIDYNELTTTGGLITTTTITPLIISRAAARQQRERAYRLSRQNRLFRTNMVGNTALDAALPIPTLTNGSELTLAEAPSELSLRGIRQMHDVGFGKQFGSIQEDGVWDAAAIAGKPYIALQYVYASDGLTFGSPNLRWRGSGGNVSNGSSGSGQNVIRYIPITSTSRLYWWRGVVPSGVDGYRAGTTADQTTNPPNTAEASVKYSGLQMFVADSATDRLSLFDTPFADLTQVYPAMNARNTAMVSTAYNALMSGESLAVVGDSIQANYNIPSLYSAAFGASELLVGALGGTKMSAAHLNDYATGPTGTTDQKKEYFSGVHMLRAIAGAAAGTSNFEDQASAASGLADTVLQARVTAMQAFDWTTLDNLVLADGTNDYNSGVALGTTGSTDETTFNGAFNIGIDAILAELPRLRIYVATPIPRFATPTATGSGSGDWRTTTNSAGLHLWDYTNALVERCAAKNPANVHCIRMDRGWGITTANHAEYIPDDTHPATALGQRTYRDLMVRKVGAVA